MHRTIAVDVKIINTSGSKNNKRNAVRVYSPKCIMSEITGENIAAAKHKEVRIAKVVSVGVGGTVGALAITNDTP